MSTRSRSTTTRPPTPNTPTPDPDPTAETHPPLHPSSSPSSSLNSSPSSNPSSNPATAPAAAPATVPTAAPAAAPAAGPAKSPEQQNDILLYHSITPQVMDKIILKAPQYTLQIRRKQIQDGVLLLKVLIDSYYASTRTTTINLRRQLSNLLYYMKSIAKGDVSKLCQHTSSVHAELEAAVEKTYDLVFQPNSSSRSSPKRKIVNHNAWTLHSPAECKRNDMYISKNRKQSRDIQLNKKPKRPTGSVSSPSKFTTRC
jgi:hypothetical protein